MTSEVPFNIQKSIILNHQDNQSRHPSFKNAEEYRGNITKLSKKNKCCYWKINLWETHTLKMSKLYRAEIKCCLRFNLKM